MTRVAIMPSAYPPRVGGVEELTRHLAITLRAGGDEVEIWANRDDAPGDPTIVSMDGLVVRRFAMPLPSSHPKSLVPAVFQGLTTLLRLRSAVRDFRPDVLHVVCFGPNGAYATALSAATGTPLMITLQGETQMDDYDIFDTSMFARAALRAGLRQARQVTGCSGHTLSDARARFGLPAAEGSVVFNGVSLAESTSNSQSTTAPRSSVPDGRYLLAVGRVVEKKGFDLLLRAWGQIAGNHPDVRLVIAGDGRMLSELKRLADELGVTDRSTFLGRCTRDEVADLMAGCESFIMPSRIEPFGIVVLEAWRAGRPVICTSRGGPAEFVDDGETGLIVDPFDNAALTEALEKLLDDAHLRAALSRAGHERVADFSWEKISDQYRRCYERTVSDSRAHRRRRRRRTPTSA